LCAGIDDDGYSFNTAAYLFTVNIVLTDAGLAAGPGGGLGPVGLMFRYLALLAASEPQQWVYQELAAISDMKWRWVRGYRVLSNITNTNSKGYLQLLPWYGLWELLLVQMVLSVLANPPRNP
jgi:secreted Zn-dependent insulinase-like peptidase